MIAWLYGPIACGALSVEIACRIIAEPLRAVVPLVVRHLLIGEPAATVAPGSPTPPWGPKTTVGSGGLRILMRQAAESITSEHPDVVAGDRVGQWS
jgi:hypothetical protein